MKYHCMNCENEDEINWQVQGDNLEEMTINFKCSKCKAPGEARIIFTAEEPKVELKIDKVSYVG